MLRCTQSTHLDATVLADIRALGRAGEDVLADVTRRFLADVPPQLLALAAAIDASDAETAWQVAHRLKASALGIGALHMADICRKVEYAAGLATFDRAAAHLGPLAAEFELAGRALEQQLCR